MESTQQQSNRILECSEIRKALFLQIVAIDDLIASIAQMEGKPGIAEATLAKRAAQTARHWIGETLAFYPTGFRRSDNPNDPGSESTAK